MSMANQLRLMTTRAIRYHKTIRSRSSYIFATTIINDYPFQQIHELSTSTSSSTSTTQRRKTVPKNEKGPSSLPPQPKPTQRHNNDTHPRHNYSPQTRNKKYNSNQNFTKYPRRYNNNPLYGYSKTRISVKLPNQNNYNHDNHPLSPYIYTSLSETSFMHKSQQKPETGFSVTFLGTGGNVPTMDRNTSCTALRLGGKMFLFDAGEGVQRQFNFTSFGNSSITKIFITHMHSDHVAGLPGLILNIQTTTNASDQDNHMNSLRKGNKYRSHDDSKNKNAFFNETNSKNGENSSRLDIYGPPGLYHYLGNALKLTYSKLNMSITVHELMGSNAAEQGKKWTSAYTNEPTYFYSNYHYNQIYPSFDHNDDEINQTQSNSPIAQTTSTSTSTPTPTPTKTTTTTTPFKSSPYWKIVQPDSSSNTDGNDRDSRNRQFYVNAVEIQHVESVPTFGYILEEPPPLPPIDPQKAQECGVQPGKKYGLLKKGISVESDDGSGRMVSPKEVLLLDQVKRGRKFVLLGDNKGVEMDSALYKLGMGCDVLVNECTANDRDHRKSSSRGHSTAQMTGNLAKQLKAKVCLLNHLNVHEDAVMHTKVGWVSAASRGVVNHVLPAFDFMELIVPAGGFDENSLKVTK